MNVYHLEETSLTSLRLFICRSKMKMCLQKRCQAVILLLIGLFVWIRPYVQEQWLKV